MKSFYSALLLVACASAATTETLTVPAQSVVDGGQTATC